jgi:ATP-dependent helicase/nuclease subunit A
MSLITSELNDVIVRAGAGAGKTTGLIAEVKRIFNLYARHGESPRILLTTFTRKATQELRERLVLAACAETNSTFLQFVSDPNRLAISTMHGLFYKFLRQVGHLAGLDAGLSLVSEHEANHLARLTLREVMLEQSQHLRWLEVYGLERVLKMCRLYDECTREFADLKPGDAAAIEATVGTVRAHWRQRFDQLAKHVRLECEDKAWLAFAESLVSFAADWQQGKVWAEDLPSKPRFSKTQAAFEALHEHTKAELEAFKKDFKKPGWDQAIWPQMVGEWKQFAELGDLFAKKIKERKESQGLFEMADLEFKTLEVLRTHPYLASVFGEAWDYWMIDEYQDTSPLQVEALEALRQGRKRYVVGDPQQSIYLFRGAEVKVFEEAEREIVAAQGDRRVLLKNYRSQPDLLHLINGFMASVSSDFAAMEAKSDVDPESARTCALLLRAETPEQELKALVWRVQQLLRDGATLEQICVVARTHKNLMDVSLAFKQAGLPTHVHASRGFEARREVMDARACWKFLINPHDNLNLMMLLRSPWFQVEDRDLAQWMESKPKSLWRKLEVLASGAASASAAAGPGAAGAAEPEAITRLRQFQTMVQKVGLANTFEEMLVQSGAIDLCLIDDPAGRKESNLWKMVLRAREVEKSNGGRPLEFLDQPTAVDLESTEGDAASAQEPNCINLMTIHASKGLEFEHVLVPRINEAPRLSNTVELAAADGCFFFPIWSQTEDSFVASPLDDKLQKQARAKELQEFDRWLYVAVTRAKSTLTLSWSVPIENESWAQRSSWCSSLPGVYGDDSFTYEVMDSFPEPDSASVTRMEATQLRSPWSTPTDGDRQARQSATQLAAAFFVKDQNEQLNLWESQRFGVKVHRALEGLRYGHTGTDRNTDPAVRFVVESEDPPLAKWIQKGHVEWGFQVRAAKGVVEGQVDLWFEDTDCIYIVDYKTGSPRRKDKAFEQLSLYAWALTKFGHKKPMQMIVVFPLAKVVERRDVTPQLLAGWEDVFSGT